MAAQGQVSAGGGQAGALQCQVQIHPGLHVLQPLGRGGFCNAGLPCQQPGAGLVQGGQLVLQGGPQGVEHKAAQIGCPAGITPRFAPPMGPGRRQLAEQVCPQAPACDAAAERPMPATAPVQVQMATALEIG